MKTKRKVRAIPNSKITKASAKKAAKKVIKKPQVEILIGETIKTIHKYRKNMTNSDLLGALTIIKFDLLCEIRDSID